MSRSKTRRLTPALIVCALLLLALAAAGHRLPFSDTVSDFVPVKVATSDEPFSVHMIDVGNADCFLIEQGEHAMLIDAGEADTADEVLDYLRARDIDRLELVIATHPHADHIGGMATVIDRIEIDRFVMQPVPEALIPTTACYRHMLDALGAATDICVIDATSGGDFPLGDATVTVFPCLTDCDDLNNYSVVCRITYKERSFLMMGDAEKEVENALLDSGFPLSSDVLKVGHHGSQTSSQTDFLRAVCPSVALISCGADNSYGHPHGETLRKLSDLNAVYYRADLCGTTVISTDGSNLFVQTEKQPAAS